MNPKEEFEKDINKVLEKYYKAAIAKNVEKGITKNEKY